MINQRRERSRSRQQEKKNIEPNIYIYNIPEHFSKTDIVYFLWKTLQKCNGLRKPTNPIVDSEYLQNQNCIRVLFRSREQALNCLDLNGIYYGVRSFYMKSQLSSRHVPTISLQRLKIRKISPYIADSFNKIYVGNMPVLPQYELIDFLSQYGELKSFVPITTSKLQSQCFCQFKSDEQTDICLTKLNNIKLKGRSIVAKRSALMNTAQTGKSMVKTILRKKPNLFQKDVHSYFVTFDTIGYFKDIKISCVLLLRTIIPLNSNNQIILEDVKKQLEKIGCLERIIHQGRNIYIQYEKVQYAQIAYLLLLNKKYDNRMIDCTFYDPIKFADDLLE